MSRIGVVLVLLSLPAGAADFKLSENFASGERFGPFGENYVFLWHRTRDNGWARGAESPLRGHLSFRYILASNDVRQFFFSYTGEFDFYWFDARPSSPVINRISNPALHLRWPGTGRAACSYLDLGAEHRSDGQVVEVASPSEAQAAQRAYDARNRAFFDQISRGSNYFSLEGKRIWNVDGMPLSVSAKVKAYVTQYSAVTWGPRAGRHDHFSDYDILTLRLGRNTRHLGEFMVQWTLGEKGLKTDSFEAGWQAPAEKLANLPIYVRWHHGPMNTLSNYTQCQDSIGIGLRFTGW